MSPQPVRSASPSARSPPGSSSTGSDSGAGSLSWPVSGLADLYLSTVLRQMAIHGTFSLLPIYMAFLGIPATQMGLVIALNTLTQVATLIGFGRLADRIGRRRIFMVGFALSALTPCVFTIARNAGGMAMAMLGLYETSRGVGGFVGPLLAGAITPLVGYTGMFLTMAAIAGVGFLVLFVRRELSWRRGRMK